MLRNALGEPRVLLDEAEIAILRRLAQRGEDAPLARRGPLGEPGRVRSRVTRDAIEELTVTRQIQLRDLGVLERLDEENRGRVSGVIGQPPILGREADRVLDAVIVDRIVAEAPARDEVAVPHHLARSLEERALGDFPLGDQGSHERHVLLAELHALAEVGEERFGRGHAPSLGNARGRANWVALAR